MSKHTVVLSFEDGKEPTYHAGMQVLGGSVGAVQFSDALEEMQLLEEQRDELLEALEGVTEMAADMIQSMGFAGLALIEAARAALAKARGTPC